MALRYTHATDEAKRRAVENLAKPIRPSDESVNRVGGGVTSAVLPHHRTYGSVYGGSQSKLEAAALFQQ